MGSVQERVVREIRRLRAMWRALETGLRELLTKHEEGSLGYKPRRNLRATAPALDPNSQLRVQLPKPAGYLPVFLPMLAVNTSSINRLVRQPEAAFN